MSTSLLARVHAVLDAAGIAHALIGANAMAAHGVGRSTLDVDLLVVSADALREPLWSAVGAAVEIRVGDTDDPLAGLIRISAPSGRPVDVVVGRAAWQREIVARSVPIETGGAVIPVAEPADLILLKLYAGGPQDRWDVQQLLGDDDGSLRAAVDREIGKLPRRCRELWLELR